ncbi:MAG: FHA domain-containing protein [bacterium]|nr:FHA domain-containing protein [bacterium]
MSINKRKIFLCCIGLLAGLAAWPVAEAALWCQRFFPTYLIFSIFLGIIFGVCIGGFFGTTDGILMSNKSNILRGMREGLLIGALGGMVGFLIAQASLFLIGEYFIHSAAGFNTIGLPISRALGWACLGVFIGMIDGIRSRSTDKIRVGIIGGISGGLLGGLSLEYLRLVFPAIVLARLIGLLIFGLSIGFLYGFVESRLSFGVLTLLNGKWKGKNFLIAQRNMRVGSSEKNDIVLDGYKNVAPEHARVFVKNNEVFIKPKDSTNKVMANDMRTKDHSFKFDDVIAIGSAKMLYHYK